ncbi:MAG TPA: hypothetical protein PK354_06145 [bacterium]|nr:hypothetical protein [bacterium]
METKPNINARTYDAPPQFCFLALKRIFLKNNFTLLKEDTQLNKIEAIKHFDKGNLSVDLLIQANLESMENNKTQVYLNAVQTTKTIYATRKTLLIIPLPGSTQVTQATKEGTIEDKKFYEVFFKAIEEELKTLRQ